MIQLLVLTRKRNQSIIIADEIEVTILEIRGDQVRLGVSAPKRVTVHRREVYEEIREANREATASSSSVLEVLKSIPKS